MSEVENPLEPFKRAMTATMRALAEDEELEVSFGPGAPSASAIACGYRYLR